MNDLSQAKAESSHPRVVLRRAVLRRAVLRRSAARARFGPRVQFFCWGALFTSLAVEVHGQEPPRFRLAFARGEGAESCLDERALAELVTARLGQNPFSDDAERSIEGAFVRSEGGFVAELRVRDAAGAPLGERKLHVETPDCAPLGEAVVLAVALTIDPNAPLGPVDEASPIEPKAPVEEPSTPPIDRAPERCPPVPHCRATPCPACPSVERSNDELELTLRGLVGIGLLPSAAPGAAVNGVFGASRFRLSLGLSYLPESATEDGVFSFGLTTGNLGACGVLLDLGRSSSSVCAELSAGSIHAVVRELEPLEPGDHLWLSAGIGPRLRFRVLSPLIVEAGGSLVVPLRRPRFVLQDQAEPVFESGVVGAQGFLGVGLGVP